MTNATDASALGHPQAVVTLVEHFDETGLAVAGLPGGWRKVRRDADLVTVSELWLSKREAELQESLAPSERFVSNAMATAWRLADLPVPADHLLQFAEAMTRGVPGWELRESVVDTRNEHGVVLLGTLGSPFGPLVSNAHSVVLPVGDDQYVLAQLAVTARPDSNINLDALRLVP